MSEIPSRSASRSRTMIGYSLPRSRNCAAVRAGDVRLDRGGHRLRRHAEHGRLRSIDADGDFRTALFAADAHVGDARACLPSRPALPAAMRRASSRSSPRISRARRASLSPPPSILNSWKLPPAGLARTMTPGRPDSWRRSSCAISSLVRSRSSRGTRRMLIWPRLLLPPPPKPPPNPPPLVMMVVGLGHVLLDHLLEPQHRLFGPLDAGADRQLGVDVDLAFVGLRQQLGREQRIDQHGRDHRRQRADDHRRPMREREVQRLADSARPRLRGTARSRGTAVR